VVRSWLGRLVSRRGARRAQDDPAYYATRFTEADQQTRVYVRWDQRAPELRASPIDDTLGVASLLRLFDDDLGFAGLSSDDWTMLGGYLDYVAVEASQQVVTQDEQADFLMIVLEGTLAVRRTQPTGDVVRLGEVGRGELLGDMITLDGGPQMMSCVSMRPVRLAVLSSEALLRLREDDPVLAATMLAWIARRVSEQMRQYAVRLSAQMRRESAST